MVDIKGISGAALLALAVSVDPSSAATLNVVGGQLIGASGVDVGGVQYDVEFVEGTCSGLFDGCDEVSDFVFQTFAAANLASLALLDQVFLDVVAGDFDTIPSLTNGIENSVLAYILTPYNGFSPNGVEVVGAGNFVIEISDGISGYGGIDIDTTNIDYWVYANWSIATVPLPATFPLLLAAIGGLGFAVRRRKSA